VYKVGLGQDLEKINVSFLRSDKQIGGRKGGIGPKEGSRGGGGGGRTIGISAVGERNTRRIEILLAKAKPEGAGSP